MGNSTWRVLQDVVLGGRVVTCETLAAPAPLAAILFALLSLTDPLGAKRRGVHRSARGAILALAWLVTCAYLFFLSVLSLIEMMSGGGIRRDGLSVGLIISILTTLQLLRFRLERSEPHGLGRASTQKAWLDFFRNVVVFLLCYAGAFGNSVSLWWTALIMAGVNVARVVKYRIWDDLVRRRVYEPGSPWLVVPGAPVHLFLRAILDIIPRAYFYTVFSFTIWNVLSLRDPLHHLATRANVFHIAESSGNLFIDFLYFNIVTIATVGYGDIRPISADAKLLCSAEIAFAFTILAAIAGIILNRFRMLAERGGGNPREAAGSDGETDEE